MSKHQRPARRETTIIATPEQINAEARIAVPAVEFVPAHPAVVLSDESAADVRPPRAGDAVL